MAECAQPARTRSSAFPSLSNLKPLIWRVCVFFCSTLDVASNQLSGPLPKALGALSNLTVLNLGGNALSGAVPAAALEGWRSLEELHLEVNQFEVRFKMFEKLVGFTC